MVVQPIFFCHFCPKLTIHSVTGILRAWETIRWKNIFEASLITKHGNLLTGTSEPTVIVLVLMIIDKSDKPEEKILEHEKQAEVGKYGVSPPIVDQF